MAESPKVPRKTYRGEDIYQDLTSTSLDKIMKYHRLANAAIEPKRAVLSELKKAYDYADSFSVHVLWQICIGWSKLRTTVWIFVDFWQKLAIGRPST